MRRHRGVTSVFIVALIAVCAPLAQAAPTSAPITCVPTPADTAIADCTIRAREIASYKGWAHLEGQLCLQSIGISCNPTYEAWRWESNRWVATRIGAGSTIYVWPFARGWSWVWTRDTGWVAMQSSYPQIALKCRFTQTSMLIERYYDPQLCSFA